MKLEDSIMKSKNENINNDEEKKEIKSHDNEIFANDILVDSENQNHANQSIEISNFEKVVEIVNGENAVEIVRCKKVHKKTLKEKFSKENVKNNFSEISNSIMNKSKTKAINFKNDFLALFSKEGAKSMLYFVLASAIIGLIAFVSMIIAHYIPKGLISASVFAMLIGMLVNPLLKKLMPKIKPALNFFSKRVLKIGIVLLGVTLSFDQIIKVGGQSLFVMIFTLVSAFGGGYLLGKAFKMNWKLSSLISAGTGICGGSAIAALSPVMEADDKDVAYAMTSTFFFDIIMVIVFPLIGVAIGMNDLDFGLWAGTAVNDTSSVVATGYSFSEIAGNYAVIVKLTRTLSIIPISIIFALISHHVKSKQLRLQSAQTGVAIKNKLNIFKIFPFFIVLFLMVVAIKSTGVIPQASCDVIAKISKIMMVCSLSAIGLKTNFKSMFSSGIKPMVHGLIISLLVAVVAFVVIMYIKF